MIYPGVGLEEWKRRFNLREIKAPCGKCGKVFSTTVPVVIQGCAGLSAPVHECGEGFVETVLTPMTSKARAFWTKIVQTL